MTEGAAEPRQDPALVPGELRGFRQFELRADGLYPLVHSGVGPWDGRLERARCAAGSEHPSPASDCRCGLYAWYLPGSATVALGPASAVVAARGRCILADRGFRAAQARIVAVTLPAVVRWNPVAASRARRMLTEQYPRTRVYASARRMLRDHPPQDVRALGIDPPRDRSRGYRAAAVALSAVVLLVTAVLAALPRFAVARGFAHWWPLLVLLAVAWQAGLVWLISRLMALQTPNPAGGGGIGHR
ncbi:MAG TPA: hypothetical protein VK204_10645 [Nocardioidaceae bacterium]|nr:hypothetical protein [Nocardioidaceae bacterium]